MLYRSDVRNETVKKKKDSRESPSACIDETETKQVTMDGQ